MLTFHLRDIGDIFIHYLSNKMAGLTSSVTEPEWKQMKELTIRSERKADQNNEVYHFQFSAQKLDDKECPIS